MGDVARDHLTDRLRAVALRDSAALRDVYDLTSAKLFGVCLRILVTRQEAEDVLQEVYLAVWARGPVRRHTVEPDHLAGDDRPQQGD